MTTPNTSDSNEFERFALSEGSSLVSGPTVENAIYMRVSDHERIMARASVAAVEGDVPQVEQGREIEWLTNKFREVLIDMQAVYEHRIRKMVSPAYERGLCPRHGEVESAHRCAAFSGIHAGGIGSAAASSPAPASPAPSDLPFDDYCAGAGDCRACKGINCTCPHHAPNANAESLYAKCRRVWVCKRCGNCLDHCKHKDESNFHEDLAMPCSVKTPAPAQSEGEQEKEL